MRWSAHHNLVDYCKVWGTGTSLISLRDETPLHSQVIGVHQNCILRAHKPHHKVTFPLNLFILICLFFTLLWLFLSLSLHQISPWENHFFKISITWYFLNTKSHVFAKRRLIALQGNGQPRWAALAQQVHAPCLHLTSKRTLRKMLASSKPSLWNFSVCRKF